MMFRETWSFYQARFARLIFAHRSSGKRLELERPARQTEAAPRVAQHEPDEVNLRVRLLGSTYVALVLAAFLAWAPCTSASALARHETSRERIRGDDDPIIVPRAVALPESQALVDPETTGSIDRRSAKPSLRCDRFAWYLDHDVESEFREVC
jgi:hypothetical protein